MEIIWDEWWKETTTDMALFLQLMRQWDPIPGSLKGI